MDLKINNFSKRVSIIIFICSCIGSIAGLLCTVLFVKKGYVAAIVSLAIVLALSPIAFIFKKYRTYNIIAMGSLGMIQFPILWLALGGINSAFLYYLFCVPLIYGIILEKAWLSVFPLINLAVDEVLIYMSLMSQTLPQVDANANYMVAFAVVYLIIYGAGFFASLNQKKVEKNLIALYMHDELTGLKNRYAFHEDIRLFSPTVFASFDIDDFKKVNDNFLHTEGDKILKAFARILKDIECDEVKCYRIGGEEFLLTSRLDIYATNDIINRYIIDRVRATLKDPEGKPVTVSCGVAYSEEKNTDLKKLSDSYLYAAKFSGKNKSK